MKNILIVMILIAGLFFFMTREDAPYADRTGAAESPGKTRLDTPANTYEERVEALSISNTLQKPVNSYLDGRVDAMGSARKSVNVGNERMEAQDKAMEELLK